MRPCELELTNMTAYLGVEIADEAKEKPYLATVVLLASVLETTL